MTTTRATTSRPPAPHGFTLIEILVVVAIIGILVALVAVAGAKMQSSAKASKTKVLLAAARAMADEYYVQTNNHVNVLASSPIDWSTPKSSTVPNDPPYPPAVIRSNTGNATEDFVKNSSERFVWAIHRLDEGRKMLASLGTENHLVDRDGNGFLEIRDGWGNVVVYVEQVTSNDPTAGFLRPHPKPFLASPGPDGQWGDVRSSASPAEQKAAEDNLYSYEMDG